MKSKRSLMTVLVGLAMLATPITAAAKDHNRGAARPAHVFAAPARSFAPARNFTPAAVTRHEFRNQRPTPIWAPPIAGRNWRDNRYENRGWRGTYSGEPDADDYQNYGNGGYYPAPAYAAPVAPYYGGQGYAGGGSCGKAQRITNTYNRDRYTGHPAAAADLLRQNQWAFRSGCGVNAGGGLLGGFTGAPAYNNYGGYNGGYGQPYGGTSMLAPLIQQFVR
jgi:hypothetical protein